MTTNSWSEAVLSQIAAADDLHIAPRRANGQTGTPTWIWSVAVHNVLYVRPYRGEQSSWYKSALQTGSGIIQSAGREHEVLFTPVDDDELVNRIDKAYTQKYGDSPYLPAMLGHGPRDNTVAVTPATDT